MLKIRLQRVGRKHEPSFRLVLTDSKNSTKSGRVNEVLGSYDPRKTNEVINGDRVKYWISQGAGLTDTVHNLLVSKGVIDEPKKNVLPKKSPPPVEPTPEAETPAETPAEASAESTPEESPTEVTEAPAETPAEPVEKDATIEEVPEKTA